MIKNWFYLLVFLAMVGCNNQKATPADNEVVDQYLEDVSAIEGMDDPIEAFARGAGESAAEQMQLTVNNVSSFIDKGKTHARTVIIVEDHTIVTITSFDDCEYSKSWDTCMPRGKGYIKKSGELIDQDDYINKIIGLPENNNQVVYFFDL